MSTAVAEFDAATKELGDKIAGLTLLQAKQVADYLKDVHGIEPAGVIVECPFDRLLSTHPDYTAGYFMAAQTLAKVGRTEEAKARLTQGTASARRTGNQHALGEMEAMLADLG